MQAKVMPEINNLDIPSIYYDSILNDEQYTVFLVIKYPNFYQIKIIKPLSLHLA